MGGRRRDLKRRELDCGGKRNYVSGNISFRTSIVAVVVYVIVASA